MRRVAQLAVLMFLLSGCTGSQATVQSGPTPSSEQPGLKGDTWTWDGASWHREAATGPSSRYLASLASAAKHKLHATLPRQTPKGPSAQTSTSHPAASK